MVAAAREAGTVLMYAENLLFVPMYQRVRELARRGRVGQPFLVKQAQCHGGPYSPWFWDIERAGGGVVLDMGCHSIHAVCWMMDAWPEAVTATMGRYAHAEKGLAEDHSNVILHFPGGAMGIAENSWAMPGGNDYLEVFGPQGRLVANLERGPSIAMYTAPQGETAADSSSRSGWQHVMYEEAWQFGFPRNCSTSSTRPPGGSNCVPAVKTAGACSKSSTRPTNRRRPAAVCRSPSPATGRSPSTTGSDRVLPPGAS